eukprot:UN21992
MLPHTHPRNQKSPNELLFIITTFNITTEKNVVSVRGNESIEVKTIAIPSGARAFDAFIPASPSFTKFPVNKIRASFSKSTCFRTCMHGIKPPKSTSFSLL